MPAPEGPKTTPQVPEAEGHVDQEAGMDTPGQADVQDGRRVDGTTHRPFPRARNELWTTHNAAIDTTAMQRESRPARAVSPT